MKDYFKILGINKNSTQEEINKAYRNLALKYHPDKNSSESASVRFKEIQEAYDYLISNYKPLFSFSSKNSVDDIFDNLYSKIFGNQKNLSTKLKLKISLEESYKGCEKIIEVDVDTICKKCQGTGAITWEGCNKCNRKGFIYLDNSLIIQSICGQCNGKGNLELEKCFDCKGNGFINSTTKKIPIQVPAGIKNNTKIRLEGEGSGGGDLYVIIDIQKDNIFERKDYNLVADIQVPYYNLIFGGNLDFYLFKEKIQINIKSQTKTGSKIFIKNLGFPYLENNNQGDLELNVKLKLPTKMTKEHKELLEKLKNFD